MRRMAAGNGRSTNLPQAHAAAPGAIGGCSCAVSGSMHGREDLRHRLWLQPGQSPNAEVFCILPPRREVRKPSLHAHRPKAEKRT